MAAATIPMTISGASRNTTWSNSRPKWQRDALRRIIVQESIEERDIEELDFIMPR